MMSDIGKSITSCILFFSWGVFYMSWLSETIIVFKLALQILKKSYTFLGWPFFWTSLYVYGRQILVSQMIFNISE
jgi:hypothetical protein